LLLTVPLAGGYGVVGLSEFDRMADPASALQENGDMTMRNKRPLPPCF
jgi:hypothetical protein